MQPPVHHTAPPSHLPPDAPEWAGVLVDILTCRVDAISRQLDQALVEVASLQSLLTPNRIHRDEAARIADVSAKTIYRWERQEHITNYAPKGKRALYEYTEIVRAKRMFKK